MVPGSPGILCLRNPSSISSNLTFSLVLTQGGLFHSPLHARGECCDGSRPGPALPAPAVSLPTGSSLLISPLLPSRGLLYQCPHRPRSQPSINRRKSSAARETGFDFSLELLPYFNIGFNRRLCLKEITIRSDSPAFKKYMPFLQSKLLEFALLLGVHLQSFFRRSLYVGRVVRFIDCTWCFEHDIDRSICCLVILFRNFVLTTFFWHHFLNLKL